MGEKCDHSLFLPDPVLSEADLMGTVSVYYPLKVGLGKLLVLHERKCYLMSVAATKPKAELVGCMPGTPITLVP